MTRIQLITILVNFIFIAYIARLIIKGKLREEYAIIWVICTILLTIFSFWPNGLEIMAKLLGVFQAPNLLFTGAIFAILIYLVHISVVSSKLHNNIRKLTQEMALLKQELEKAKQENKDPQKDPD
ncbi:DUF2304 domain-containing protein [Pedobacter sp. R20-19]|uniref:DUF2304 domain-containing protein n=1 Tax=Pedobacter sp. R20-19 TaxID=1270196 RepID=UPI000493163C|nr:DUF2304 domain-containing protein [Pedobacter sp. R20-19]